MTALFEARLLGASGDELALSLPERVLLAGRVAWFYLAKLALPVNLTFIYPRFRIDAHDPGQYLSALAAAAVLAGAWLLRRSRAPLAVALFFGGSLLPVSRRARTARRSARWKRRRPGSSASSPDDPHLAGSGRGS